MVNNNNNKNTNNLFGASSAAHISAQTLFLHSFLTNMTYTAAAALDIDDIDDDDDDDEFLMQINGDYHRVRLTSTFAPEFPSWSLANDENNNFPQPPPQQQQLPQLKPQLLLSDKKSKPKEKINKSKDSSSSSKSETNKKQGQQQQRSNSYYFVKRKFMMSQVKVWRITRVVVVVVVVFDVDVELTPFSLVRWLFINIHEKKKKHFICFSSCFLFLFCFNVVNNTMFSKIRINFNTFYFYFIV